MAVTLTDLEKVCGETNAKNITNTIYLAFKKDVDSIPAATGHVVSTSITMKTGKVFTKLEISKFDKSYISEPEGNADGSVYKTTIKGFHPKLRAAATEMLAGITNGCEIVAIIEDRNGNKRIIGNLTEAADFKATEKNDNDKNGYECEINWESALPAYFYTASIPV